MDEHECYLGFSVFPGIGPGRFVSLLSRFGSAKESWKASQPDLQEVIGPVWAKRFVEFRNQFVIDAYKRTLNERHVTFLTSSDSAYPQQIRDLENPPFVLYVKGQRSLLQQEKRIGIVGTRKMTTYGKAITESFTRDLVDEGFVIVSGLALGVDAIAHKTTVDSGGKTIAVLGCGVDCCYPNSNQRLYDQILETEGTIVSEYPLGATPNKGSFPSRNRIIAALSQAVLVTEGAEDSGSLITAQKALELGRVVFSIPGPVTSSLSRGPLKLIRKGAKLVTSGREIPEELGLESKGSNRKLEVKGDTKEEQEVIDCLIYEDLSFDELVRKTGISTIRMGTLLSLMEMKGVIFSQNNSFHLKSSP